MHLLAWGQLCWSFHLKGGNELSSSYCSFHCCSNIIMVLQPASLASVAELNTSPNATNEHPHSNIVSRWRLQEIPSCLLFLFYFYCLILSQLPASGPEDWPIQNYPQQTIQTMVQFDPDWDQLSGSDLTLVCGSRAGSQAFTPVILVQTELKKRVWQTTFFMKVRADICNDVSKWVNEILSGGNLNTDMFLYRWSP